uniref:Uncharacterized protein n=1 Tax=Triticum urartu TaxID=4572 RepID=A0A8R7QWI5_TRIUA
MDRSSQAMPPCRGVQGLILLYSPQDVAFAFMDFADHAILDSVRVVALFCNVVPVRLASSIWISMGDKLLIVRLYGSFEKCSWCLFCCPSLLCLAW